MKYRLLIIFLLISAFTLIIAPAFAGQNILTWDDLPNEDRYYIERKNERCSDTVAPWVEIAQTGANITTYTDLAVTEGLTYCYRAAASNAAGKGPYSTTAGRTVPITATIPAAPTNLRAN